MTERCRMLLGTSLLTAGKGGIARVARMTVKALDEQMPLDVVSLIDREPVEIGQSRAHPCAGSQLRYVAEVHRRALRATHAIYDSVGVARAHPRLPGLRRPYAVWIHGIEIWYALSNDRRRALQRAELVLVNSQFTLQKFETLHGELPRARVCELATEEDLPPDQSPTFSGRPIVLCVGRIDVGELNKGHHALLEAWPEVIAHHPGARLVCAGGGNGLDAFRQLAAASPVAESIDVMGFVPEADMAKLWAGAHIFALPSRKEGFGIVYAEAMRHSLPVVATRHDAGQEVNVDGVTGFNVDLEASGNLADRLIALLSAPEKARTMGEAGFARWRERYRYGAFVDRLTTALSGFIGQPSRIERARA